MQHFTTDAFVGWGATFKRAFWLYLFFTCLQGEKLFGEHIIQGGGVALGGQSLNWMFPEGTSGILSQAFQGAPTKGTQGSLVFASTLLFYLYLEQLLKEILIGEFALF